jgi:hypothetical protein
MADWLAGASMPARLPLTGACGSNCARAQPASSQEGPASPRRLQLRAAVTPPAPAGAPRSTLPQHPHRARPVPPRASRARNRPQHRSQPPLQPSRPEARGCSNRIGGSARQRQRSLRQRSLQDEQPAQRAAAGRRQLPRGGCRGVGREAPSLSARAALAAAWAPRAASPIGPCASLHAAPLQERQRQRAQRRGGAPGAQGQAGGAQAQGGRPRARSPTIAASPRRRLTRSSARASRRRPPMAPTARTSRRRRPRRAPSPPRSPPRARKRLPRRRRASRASRSLVGGAPGQPAQGRRLPAGQQALRRQQAAVPAAHAPPVPPRP